MLKAMFCGPAAFALCLRERLGWVPVQANRSLTIVAGDPEATIEAFEIARILHRRYPRSGAQILSETPIAIADAAVHRPPWPFKSTVRRFLKRSQTGILVFVGEPAAAHRRLLRRAWRRGAAIFVLLHARSGDRAKLESLQAAAGRQRHNALVDRIIVLGIDPARWSAGENEICMRSLHRDLADAAIVDGLIDTYFSRSSRQTAADRRPLKRANAVRLWQSAPLRPLFDWKFPRAGNIEELRARLGAPDTILCLGNGPSSEDPRLRELRHDSLFRVNVSWLERGVLIRPDLVFTNLRTAVERLRPSAGFVVRTVLDERSIWNHFLYAPRRIPLTTAEALGLYDRAAFDHLIPTTGVLMIAAAVALRPRHLIIAGIDLYTHPQGAYPGDTSPGGYTLGHERELDLRLIRTLLERHHGEYTLIGPLKDAIEIRNAVVANA